MTTIRRWMLAAAGVAVVTACAPGAPAARGIEAIRAFYAQDVAAADGRVLRIVRFTAASAAAQQGAMASSVVEVHVPVGGK